MKRLIFLSVLAVFVLSCSLVATPAVLTPAVIVVTATPLPATSTPYPTYTPYPTQTAIPPTQTPYPTYTPYPTNTPQTGVTQATGAPVVTVSVDTQCRIGPGKDYIQLSGLVVGKTGKVVGKSADGLYWIIKNPTDIGNCWLWGEFATVSGDTSNLKVFEEPDWLKKYTFRLSVATWVDPLDAGKCWYQAYLKDWPQGMAVTFQARQRIAGEWKELISKDVTLVTVDGNTMIGPGTSMRIRGDQIITVISATVNGAKTLIATSVDENNCK